MPLLFFSPLAQSARANFVLAAAKYLIGLSVPERCCISSVALAPVGNVLRWQLFAAWYFFFLAIELVKLLCLPNGGGLGGSRLPA